MEAYDYSQINPGDFIIVGNSRSWTSYRLGVVTKVKSHSVDAVIFLDGGLEYRPDIWHEDDPRTKTLGEHAINRGMFRETEFTKRLRLLPEVMEEIRRLRQLISDGKETARAPRTSAGENRGNMDREAQTRPRG